MAAPVEEGGTGTALALGSLLVGLLVWLWPIGIGGRMPVGGDVTQFSIGLMAVLGRTIRSGRLPLWNDLWGYGFPGVGESQMGVFYPPHLLLYGLLPTEVAYAASLVLHTIWGGLGGWWAARRFGVSPAGSALAGSAWSASGFFVIHLPHQWGYTAGSWMPWAWGLAWLVVGGRGTRRTPFLLAVVLTLQVLPGHFQLAFITQVGVALLGLWSLAERASGRPSSVRGVAEAAAAMAAILPLAAMQLWPTLRLARLAASRRDLEYLSGFAATPLHLVSYVAPELFRGSPLWRPLAWDPFHTSPEEHLAYVGLVPLFLALLTIRHEVRRDPATRALTALAAVTLVLSLGPYVPGYASWSRLPGFSYFRAPARWSLATELALSLLAGKGFDAWRTWPRPGRSLARFVLLAALGPMVAVAAVELALTSTERPGWPAVARGLDAALRTLPWSRDSDFRDLAALATIARRRQDDLRVESALARQGRFEGSRVFARARPAIYLRELAETAGILLVLLGLAPFASRRRSFETALVVLTAVDLWHVGHHRAFDLGPIRSLVAQSPVLARLARDPRGTRVVDASRNLPMVVDAAPISAYRTLDLPALESLTSLAHAPLEDGSRPEDDAAVVAALRATGTGMRVLDPFERPLTRAGRMVERPLPGWAGREEVRDPALAGWLYGKDWVNRHGPKVSTFTVWRPQAEPAKAWLVPLTSSRGMMILESRSGDPKSVLGVLGRATPLATRAPSPERMEVDVVAKGPALVVVSQLADPQWRARWSGRGGERPATIVPVFRGDRAVGWQGVRVPEPGAWTLHLEYRGWDVQEGLIVSALAWWVGILAYRRFGRGPHSSRGEPT
ncbi:MAG: hypothetical protein JO116_13915 [Planctomycetaceae bacterium]|nr:hypothetical protein [Planctomycetaceae bacterium]